MAYVTEFSTSGYEMAGKEADENNHLFYHMRKRRRLGVHRPPDASRFTRVTRVGDFPVVRGASGVYQKQPWTSLSQHWRSLQP